jgi:hypothetical protein
LLSRLSTVSSRKCCGSIRRAVESYNHLLKVRELCVLICLNCPFQDD